MVFLCHRVNLGHETLNGGLEVLDVIIELTLAVGKDGAGYHSAGDSAGISEGNLAGNKDVMNVLLLTNQRKVQQDLERLRIGGQNDEVRLLTVQRLGGWRKTSFQSSRVLVNVLNAKMRPEVGQ